MLQRQLTWMTLLVLLSHHGVRTEDLLACEETIATISCELGTIQVVAAHYGRLDSTTCSNGIPDALLKNTECSLPSAFGLVSESCERQRSCSFPVDDTFFNAPCSATFKYLTVSYKCIPVTTDPPTTTTTTPTTTTTTTPTTTTSTTSTSKQLVTCEGSTASITCAQGTIQVLAANYGRTDRRTCSAGRPAGQLSNVQCSLPSSLSLVARRCDGQQNCAISVGNTVFTDPCRGTHKYLSVWYNCVLPVTAPPKTRITCFNERSTISCEGRRTLRIHHANYGRTDVNTCPHPSVNAFNFRCISVQTKTVQLWCNGRNHCHLHASNLVFIDQCPRVRKYLEVSYSCV